MQQNLRAIAKAVDGDRLAVALRGGWQGLGAGMAVFQRADLAWKENVLPMHRLWVGPQCDQSDLVVLGEEDVLVGVEMVAEVCGDWGE